VESVRSMRVRLEVEEPDFAVEGVYAADRAGRVRVEIYLQRRRVFSEGLDERGGWSMDENGPPRDSTEDAVAALEHGRLFNLYGLQELPRLGHRIVLEGHRTSAGRQYDVLRLELSDGFRTWRWIDSVTGQITIQRDLRPLHPDVDPRPLWIENRYSDFRRVEGVVFPFASEQLELASGRWMQRTRVLSLEINPCLPEEDLRRPAGPSGG
jgi:hypothetical protein